MKTGIAALDFGNCHEQETMFKLQCNTPGKPAGTILILSLTYHIVNLNDPFKGEANTPGIAFTGVNTTFTCLGLEGNHTGNFLGHLETVCSMGVATTSMNFDLVASTGTNKYTQITKTGSFFV
jgi:hypothetical protein